MNSNQLVSFISLFSMVDLRRFFFAFLFLLAGFSARTETDSCHLRMSLLTCSPGDELYSTFGHSALRVQDRNSGMDIVFNFGTFDFDDPDFYMKFVRGKLNYFLSVEYFHDFRYSYAYEKRSIIEQELDLPCSEKQRLLEALQLNAQEENKYYKYDFLFDNCTTRLRDLLEKHTNPAVRWNYILPEKVPTFRDMIHQYLNAGGQDWSKLGIDILLGSRLDRKVSNRESMFLPDYLLRGYDSASIMEHPLVDHKRTILATQNQNPGRGFFKPIYLFSLLFIGVLFLRFSGNKRWAPFLRLVDWTFFGITGLLGFLLLFMWAGTDHRVCGDNFNLLWALPTNLPAVFLLARKNRIARIYFRFVFLLSLLLLAGWYFIPQTLNPALLPVIGILILRSFQPVKISSKAHDTV